MTTQLNNYNYNHIHTTKPEETKTWFRSLGFMLSGQETDQASSTATASAGPSRGHRGGSEVRVVQEEVKCRVRGELLERENYSPSLSPAKGSGKRLSSPGSPPGSAWRFSSTLVTPDWLHEHLIIFAARCCAWARPLPSCGGWVAGCHSRAVWKRLKIRS